MTSPSRAPSEATLTNEHTPLLTTVRVAPYHRPHRHSTCTRFLYIVFQVLVFFAILSLLVLIPFHLFPTINFPFSKGILPYPTFPASEISIDELMKILHKTPKPQKVREWSKYYTSGPHLAGKNLSQAIWTKERWEEHGIKSEIVAYDCYINYPIGSRIAMLDGDDTKKVIYEASLKEDVLKEDPTTGLEDSVPVFHGYSANGNVTGPFIFGAYCTFNDFEKLVELNIPIEGHIVLCRYGYIFRGLKVKRAQELGAIGVIIYTDPGDDELDGSEGGGNGSKGLPYPKGPGRAPSSVQRGSVSFMSILPGDPSTPEYPSLPGAPRGDPTLYLPKIPSLPISYLDAIPFLKALNGYGAHVDGWKGGLQEHGVEYWTGPIGYGAPGKGKPSKTEKVPSRVINLYNEVEYTITPIWDVIGVINGSTPDFVAIGNHRDAWIAGGAADPNSGSATVMELVRSFGVMLKRGWKPLRTIVIASWDGEEIGLLGSTEWVEDHMAYIKENAVAYLNLDVSVAGSVLRIGASPLLNTVVNDALKGVEDPNANAGKHPHDKNRTSVYDVWHKYIGILGSGSDFTAWLDHAGIPSSDFSFSQGPGGAVYHYHSNYDSFHWMDTYGDPTWEYHTVATKILGAMALSLIETPVIPFNTTNYAYLMSLYLDKIKNSLPAPAPSAAIAALDSLHKAIQDLHTAAIKFDTDSAALSAELAHEGDRIKWWRWWSRLSFWYRIRNANEVLMNFEKKFLYQPGLDGRPFFKHVNFAPGLWTGYSGAVYPGLVESVDNRNWTGVEKWCSIIEDCVNDATKSLQ